VRGRATGTLMVANQKAGRIFTGQAISLVETFADQASIAIEYGRAQGDQRRLQLMDERERIAKELHDGIIQSLFAVGMGLQGTALGAGSPDVAARRGAAIGEVERRPDNRGRRRRVRRKRKLARQRPAQHAPASFGTWRGAAGVKRTGEGDAVDGYRAAAAHWRRRASRARRGHATVARVSKERIRILLVDAHGGVRRRVL